MSRQVSTVTIAASASLSDAVNIGGEYTLVGILVPSTWTAADITIAGAVHPGTTQAITFGGPATPLEDTLTYVPVNDLDSEFIITSVPTSGGALITIPDGLLEGVQFLKIRSGTAAAPVVQAGARTIQLVVAE